MWKHTVADPHGEGAAEPAPWGVGNQSTMVALTSDETWTAVPNSRPNSGTHIWLPLLGHEVPRADRPTWKGKWGKKKRENMEENKERGQKGTERIGVPEF